MRLILVVLFISSVGLLAIAKYLGDPPGISSLLAAAEGTDGILWQVQTTLLSVGFAGLAIAAQLFAEAPLAIGASRRRVFKYIGADLFVGVGLVSNAVVGIETIWFSSELGVGLSVVWFVATIYLLVRSTIKLMDLFGNPSLLDEMVRVALVESLSGRIEEVSRKYSKAMQQLDGLVVSSWRSVERMSPAVVLRIPVPRVGAVIKEIKPNTLRQVRELLSPRASPSRPSGAEGADIYTQPQVVLGVEFGDRTRLGDVAFRVITHEAIDEPQRERITQLLQSSIEFETPDTVTPDEETDREIANLKDAVGTSMRSGAFATAERAVRLLAEVLRGVWTTSRRDGTDSSRRALSTRRDWLFRSMAEVEQDAVLSSRAAGVFVGQAVERVLEAPSAGSAEYTDECLRSFTRIWIDILQQPGTEFVQLRAQIVVNVQNIAAFSAPGRGDLSIRATWVMVELAKLGLDARKYDAAVLAADGLGGLSKGSDRDGTLSEHVRAGQLILAGWLEYLAGKGDDRNPTDGGLRALVVPKGTRAEILAARNLVERGEVPFSRWDWWEAKISLSSRGQVLEFSHYIDQAQLDALARSYGALRLASDQQTASQYQRLLRLLDERRGELSAAETDLKEMFIEEIAKWETAENDRLSAEPLSQKRIDNLTSALKGALDADNRLATKIPIVADVPEDVDVSQPVLWMNLRIPRHYLVDGIFNQTHADPAELGQVFASAFIEGEECKIVDLLRSIRDDRLQLSVHAIRERVDELGDQGKHYVLLTPYGGLIELDGWHSAEFREALNRVIHIETSALDEQIILFDVRTTVASCRKPQHEAGLVPVGDTSIALGVFEDVPDADEPQVRLEAGEYFVVWPGLEPQVIIFGVESLTSSGADKL